MGGRELPDKDDLKRGTDSDVLEKQDEEIKEPEMWNVLLHNDNYTTKEFVVEILSTVFQLSAIEATKLMLFVHRNGKGVVGTYTWDIAQSKITRVHAMAKRREFPLRCSLDKA
ncbi:MAG: ATP-dependent Clp protease adaptor ClpS [Spirochaetales bacterium]|nr:ATP-dependent Clp protease adaptor ClpS [Spirochaetales bacterium]